MPSTSPGELRVLAESVRRRVLLVETGEGAGIVRKEYLARTPLRRLREAIKAMLGQAASQREARALRGVSEAGVVVPPALSEGPIGFGQRYLEMGFVEGRPLVDLIRAGNASNELLTRIGEQLRRAHAAGWVHGDLHESNVLVAGLEPRLIDWQRARRRGRARGARVADVARFEHSMRLHGLNGDDCRGFRHAALGAASAGDDERDARDVAAAVGERAREFGRARRRRVLRAEDGRFEIGLPGLRGLRDAGVDDDEIRRVLERHAALDVAAGGDVTEHIGRRLERGGDVVLKRDHRSVVTAIDLGPRSFVVKQVRKAGWRRRLADGFRGSPARRGWQAAQGLLVCGLATARPLAFVEERAGLKRSASWLVMEDLRGLWPVAEVPSAEPPYTEPPSTGPHESSTSPPRPSAAATASAMYRLLAHLHAADVAFGDLQAHHVLLRPLGHEGVDFEPVLIDVDGVRFDARLGTAERIADIASLRASMPEGALPDSAWLDLCKHLADAMAFDRSAAEVHAAVLAASERSRRVQAQS